MMTRTKLARESLEALPSLGVPLLDAQLAMRNAYRLAATFGVAMHDLTPADAKAVSEVSALAAEVISI